MASATKAKAKPKPPTYVMPPGTVRVVSVDSSLTGTGMAVFAHAGAGLWECRELATISTKRVGCARMDEVVAHIAESLTEATGAGPTVGVIEGPAFARPQGAHEMGGMWWSVARLFHHRGVPLAIMVPTARAKYAAGSGTADKDSVLLAVARRFAPPAYTGPLPADNNQTDAFAMGAAMLDAAGQPLLPMPAANREALEGIYLL